MDQYSDVFEGIPAIMQDELMITLFMANLSVLLCFHVLNVGTGASTNPKGVYFIHPKYVFSTISICHKFANFDRSFLATIERFFFTSSSVLSYLKASHCSSGRGAGLLGPLLQVNAIDYAHPAPSSVNNKTSSVHY